MTNSNIKTPFHAVLISDLHDSVFGEDNETLVSKIRALDPDVIFIAGDLVNSDDQNESIAVNLIKKLAEIAPVYASMGNHEEEYDENFNAAIENDYKVAYMATACRKSSCSTGKRIKMSVHFLRIS